MRLRPYQLEAVEKARELTRSGVRRVCVVAPTGAGKSIIAAHIADSAARLGRKVLFLAHRFELIEQLSDKLDLADLDHGIIQGAHPRKNDLPVQVASVATLIRRKLPEADLLIVDECHHAPSASFRKLIDAYPAAVILGFTATPFRLDGRGLGEFFDGCVNVAHIDELIEAGWLVPPLVIGPEEPDVSMVRKVAGDFDPSQLASVMDKPVLIGNAVETWLQRAQGRTSVYFATSIRHSLNVVDAFRAAGIPAEHVDGTTPLPERAAILARAAAGTTLVLCNVGILGEGWDLPRVSCVGLLRPTQSRALNRQMCGRGLRTFEGKTNCVILDHAGNWCRHGLPTERDEPGLSGAKRRAASQALSVRQCPLCYACAPGTAWVCPACAEPFPVRHRPLIATKAGELGEVTWKERTTPDRRAELLEKWERIAKDRGYKSGYARAIYRSTFGEWPDANHRQVG